MPTISPARRVGFKVSTAFLAFSASREPIMILTPGAPKRSASAPPRFPVPPTIATLRFSMLLNLSKKVFPFRTQEILHRSFLLFNFTAAHDYDGYRLFFSHHQFSRGRNLVRNRRYRRPELVSIPILCSTFIFDRFEPCDSHCNINRAQSPCTAKTVANDNRWRHADELLDFGADLPSGGVRIFRQQRSFPQTHIGAIHACIRADKPVIGFYDDRAAPLADNPLAFRQDQFDQSRIFVELPTQFARVIRHPNCVQWK